MTEYRRVTITLPDGSQIFRMVPEGLSAESGYSQAQSGMSWAKDHKPAEAVGVSQVRDTDVMGALARSYLKRQM